ncbi:piggyBac transposable element-derived protein 4-like [Onthophagus taurus]|uniref:piggyBac transposable element-derived protein 4-like n=1 Tax=Onthophagus taurus TaxID=166361 RepID=UPI0039BDDF56
MHNDTAIDQSTGEKAKPEVVSFYNMTKGGVDVVDRMITAYNPVRNTRRWPMVIFYGLMNVAAINAFIIYKANNPDGEFSKSRRMFLKNLGTSLLKENMRQRAVNARLPRKVRETAGRLSGLSASEDQQDPPPNKRGYCKYCKRRKTRYFCKFCRCWLCMDHITACCRECTEKN